MEKTMADSKDELFEHIPECVEVKLAYDLSRIPILGYLFFGVCNLICCIKLGRKNAANSYWLRKGAERLGLNKIKITLFEIIVILSMLAILGVAFMPHGHDEMGARYSTTQQNLQALRSAIDTYQARTGTFPSDDLREFNTVPFDIAGRMRTILRDIPPEMISKEDMRPAEQNPPNRRVYNRLGDEGGWFYDPLSGRVFVNYNKPLGEEWGRYAGQNPSTW
jgi:type II secretory pathway pseudopilin PulG